MTMEFCCVRLIRSRQVVRSLPATLTRDVRTSLYRWREPSVARRSFFSPSIQLSSTVSCCQRTDNSVAQLHYRTLCQRRLFVTPQNVTRGLFTVGRGTPNARAAAAPVHSVLLCDGTELLLARPFHTSSQLRAVPPPLLWLVLKPLQKILAMILGRSIRKWWAALPPNRQQLLRQATWRRRWQLAAGTAVATAILALFLLTHLDESPVTARTRLLVFSRENYMELAAITAEGYMEEFTEMLVPEKDPRHQVVERLVQHLAQRNQDIPEVASVPWTVHVVDSPTVNAFVLPNGKVFMFTGMLEAVADVHQLTFIMGHEMAHAVMGHSAEQASMCHVVDLLSLILLTAIWAVCPRDSLALLTQWIQSKLIEFMVDRPYSRKLEAEADQVGLQLAAKACADVRAGPVFWQQMEVRDQLTGEPSVPEWLSTHPSHRNRVTQLDRLVPEALRLRESCACPALPATDPRAVFSRSVRLLLDDAKERGREGEEERLKTPPPTAAGVQLHTHTRTGGLATSLLASAAPGPGPDPEQEEEQSAVYRRCTC